MSTEETLPGLVENLRTRKEAFAQGGGPKEMDRQHAAGKLTARERLDLLFDPGTFIEIGPLANHHSTHPDLKDRITPADGVITGYGKVDGRMICVAAYDFTVMAGSMGATGEYKVGMLREMAVRQRLPIIWLLDSAGARIQETTGSQFAGSGYLFKEQVLMSGVIPQVAAVMGPCAAGTAYIPGLADFVPMVRGTGSMALGGPHLVKAATGEEVDVEELGGSKVHCEISGVGDLETADDAACIAAIKDYLSFFPSHSGERPPRKVTGDPASRREESLYKVLPASQRRAYDMHKIISRIVDEGHFFEIKPGWAKNLLTGFARIDGYPIGIVASNPIVLGGILDVNSADKGARFINLCDAFNIPLLFLCDTPGFVIGSQVERQGIIRHGAKMIYAVSEASVPKFTVVVRKAYGAGYYAMCGKGYDPDLIVAWPTAEISVMGPEGAVNIIGRRVLAQAAEQGGPEAATALRDKMLGQFRQVIDPYLAASYAYIDDIIDPADTRQVLARALELTKEKTVIRHTKKHGVMPV
ncbi:MAG TPA: acyl-CoA carboxylase subunit beta [Chloroflexia bacterium]|nr:acyl-CoA carboxylase subunit beta [Chloroflexia bacterium]